MQNGFWQNLDKLIHDSEIIIDRPKGAAHPKYPAMIYPCDYCYLKDTTSIDGNEIDVWRGSGQSAKLNAIICTVDNLKKDCEIKLLVGCNEEEINTILSFHNNSEVMSGILIRRED